jgi:hypothetical protein
MSAAEQRFKNRCARAKNCKFVAASHYTRLKQDMQRNWFLVIGASIVFCVSAANIAKADRCGDLRISASSQIAPMINKLLEVVRQRPIDHAVACQLERDTANALRKFARDKQILKCPDAPRELPRRPVLPPECASLGIHF